MVKRESNKRVIVLMYVPTILATARMTKIMTLRKDDLYFELGNLKNVHKDHTRYFSPHIIVCVSWLAVI